MESIQQLNVSQLKSRLAQAGDQPILLDVRESWEYNLCALPGSVHIPMGQIPARLADIPQGRPLIVVCHHGMRSYQVAEFLLARGFSDVANLDGGIDAWARVVDPTLARY